MRLLELLTTEGCHLCELAVGELVRSLDHEKFEVDLVDIAFDDALLDQYGTRIPVLRDPTSKAELNWPFDQPTLLHFIEQLND